MAGSHINIVGSTAQGYHTPLFGVNVKLGIGFFLLRNIRRKLMSENKISTYILYAIGEITLVVIGILIAVQIDDWSQHQTDRKLEQAYVQNLKEDL